MFEEDKSIDFLQIMSRMFGKDEAYTVAELSGKFLVSPEYESDEREKIYIVGDSSNSKQDMYVEEEETSEKSSKPTMRKQLPKWLVIAWDAFRAIDNHKKGGFLKSPYIPSETPKKRGDPDLNFVQVKYPISIETIGHKLTLELYSSFESFLEDMQAMFSNQKVYFEG